MCSLLGTWINGSKWQSQLPLKVVVKGCCFQACIIPVACQCSWHRNWLLTSVHDWAWSQLPIGASPLALFPEFSGLCYPTSKLACWEPGPHLCFSVSNHFFSLLPGQPLLHTHVSPPQSPPRRGFWDSPDGVQPRRHPHLSVPLFPHDHSWKLDHPVYLLFVHVANENIWWETEASSSLLLHPHIQGSSQCVSNKYARSEYMTTA